MVLNFLAELDYGGTFCQNSKTLISGLCSVRFPGASRPA